MTAADPRDPWTPPRGDAGAPPVSALPPVPGLVAYRIPPELLPKLQRRQARRAWLVVPISFLGAIGAMLAFRVRVGDLAITVPMLAVMMVLVARSVARRIEASWLGFEVGLTETQLFRATKDHPILELSQAEITAIREQKDGALVVVVKRFALTIPPEIERRAELRARLAAWRPIEPGPPMSPLVLTLSALAGIVLSGVALFAGAPALVVPAALVLAGVVIWSYVLLRRSPAVDPNVRKTAWVQLAFAAFMVWRALRALGVL